MPRIRTIKPEFFTDAKVGSLSPYGRLCFIGLWCLADDFGTVNLPPEAIRGQLFPFDYSDPELDIDRILKELENLRLIVRYGPNRQYIYIPNFHKHQKIDKPSVTRSAPPPEEFGVPVSPEYAEFCLKVQEFLSKTRKNPPRVISPKLKEALERYESQKSSGFMEMGDTWAEDGWNMVGTCSEHGQNMFGKCSFKETEMETETEKETERETERKKQGDFCDAYASHVAAARAATTCEPEAVEKIHPLKEGQKKKRANKTRDLPVCPCQEIVELYHEILPELPRCKVLNESRKGYIRARWREVLTNDEIRRTFLDEDELGLPPKKAGLLWFRRYFEWVRESDFLMGRSPPSKGRDKPFRATLEWLMRPLNFAKVLEGFYHRERSPWSDLSPVGRKTAMAAMELIRELREREAKDALEDALDF